MINGNDLVVVYKDHFDYNPNMFFLHDLQGIRAMLREFKDDCRHEEDDIVLKIWLDKQEGNRVEVKTRYKGSAKRDNLVRKISLMHYKMATC